MLCLASAHALVRLDYGTFVGDGMEKTALEAFDWALIFCGKVTPTHPQAPAAVKPTVSSLSSALKRTLSVPVPKDLGSCALTTVKGAPETIKTMLASIPDCFDETCKWFTKCGYRVLALG